MWHFYFFDIICKIIATADALAAGALAADVLAADELFQKTFLKTKMLQKKCEIFHEIFETKDGLQKTFKYFMKCFIIFSAAF